MLEKTSISNVLFLDIETVPQQSNFTLLDDEMQVLYKEKTKYQRQNEISVEDFYDRAGIWAEFGKIVCISVGYFTFKKGDRQFRITSFIGDEQQILKDFSNLLENYFSGQQYILCGHNAKEFDFPYIARRMIIHGQKLPSKLSLFGKKPWEVPHLDTMEMWKFGDYKHFTSLKLLANILQIPSPKDDINGADVAKVYYQEKNIERIAKYCEKDVLTVAQILLRFKGEKLLDQDEVFLV